MASNTTVAAAVAELAGTFAGQLLRPADAGYEDARKVHNGLVDKRPAFDPDSFFRKALEVAETTEAH